MGSLLTFTTKAVMMCKEYLLSTKMPSMSIDPYARINVFVQLSLETHCVRDTIMPAGGEDEDFPSGTSVSIGSSTTLSLVGTNEHKSVSDMANRMDKLDKQR